jgi:hypothetical protein
VRRVGVPLSSHITYIITVNAITSPKFRYVFVVGADCLVLEGLTEEVDTAAPVCAGVRFKVTVKDP